MKREEKNLQTRRKIMDRALTEFAQQGYGASSINTICADQGISKGIIYHYFSSKDDLFLACVEECFTRLTEHLSAITENSCNNIEQQLTDYFTARMNFFVQYPQYQRIFSEAVVSPPAHLKAEIQERKEKFDRLNVQTLQQYLHQLPLRAQIQETEVIETFRLFQDFINAKYQVEEFGKREESCKRALNILLYGVIERKED